MPGCFDEYNYINLRLDKIRTQVAAKMISEGWHPKANKFATVRNRRAAQLYRKEG